MGFRTFRAKLRTAFLALGLAAIAFTGWEASVGATEALRETTRERLTALQQTRRRQIERYFADLGNHVLALSSDESAIRAMEEFSAAWRTLPESPRGTAAHTALATFYRERFTPTVTRDAGGPEMAASWFPADPRAVTLQHLFLAANPHPLGAKDRLLEAPGPYGAVHARYHPTLHRYQSAFGFYDVFLIEAGTGRVLYTVFKEVDLGVRLSDVPYSASPLAEAFRRASALTEPEQYVTLDYRPYLPSHLTPAAFVAAPIWRAGRQAGTLAIQISINEVNRVMTAEHRWSEEGLGRSGQAYIVGADGTLRSDLRGRIERPEGYYVELERAGTEAAVVDEVQRHGTAILRLRPPARAEAVLRSEGKLHVAGLDWKLVAEMDEAEAFEPARRLRNRIALIGIGVALAFWAAAAWLAGSVTRPLQALIEGTERLAGADFSTRLSPHSNDEFGQLAHAFNRMASELDRTTVSRAEYRELAGRLITAQEDERRRVGRELHDDLTQRLAAVAIQAGMLEHQTGEPAARAAAAKVKDSIARLSGDVHALSRRLHPSILDDLGLVAALEQECRGFFERGGPPVDFSATGDWSGASPDVQLALYRIAQEALHNIHKHAGAEHVAIRLGQLPDGEAALTITDDGRGFDRAAPDWRPGIGLASMQERARLLGGLCTVHSEPARGTTLEVRIPRAATESDSRQAPPAAG
ncbi:MAG: HAMP domain-containing protein [Bryobacterales bacterium]|nr:HAMP domain-containing protein [Bryobacterales bacterium]